MSDGADQRPRSPAGDAGPEAPDETGFEATERRLQEGRVSLGAPARSRIREAIAATRPLRGRPPHLYLLVAAYALSGLLLLTVAILGLAGTGPLAP